MLDETRNCTDRFGSLRIPFRLPTINPFLVIVVCQKDLTNTNICAVQSSLKYDSYFLFFLFCFVVWDDDDC